MADIRKGKRKGKWGKADVGARPGERVQSTRGRGVGRGGWGWREKAVPASMLLFQPFHPLINM